MNHIRRTCTRRSRPEWRQKGCVRLVSPLDWDPDPKYKPYQRLKMYRELVFVFDMAAPSSSNSSASSSTTALHRRTTSSESPREMKFMLDPKKTGQFCRRQLDEFTPLQEKNARVMLDKGSAVKLAITQLETIAQEAWRKIWALCRTTIIRQSERPSEKSCRTKVILRRMR